jgi:GNAT superfamily N-acetyltransferase
MTEMVSGPLVIAEAQKSDLEEMLAIQRLAFTEEMKLYGFFDIPPITETPEEISEAFAGRVFLKATLDGRIVGSVRAERDGVSCLVGRLSVQPELWNRGIGRALMVEIENRCGGGCRLELFTGSKSAKNIKLYEKLGYRTFREQEVSEEVKLLYMEKLLDCGNGG